MAQSIVSLTIERIADLLIHEALFLNDVKEEVESLKGELERMKSFLKDVDRKQEQDERLRARVREIRDLAYDAEDVIDSYILKTTLAKKVYNHNDVKKHFDCCAWVFISQQCKPREVLHGVLIKILSPSIKDRELIDKLKEDELVEKLYDVLKDKRYLVVFDDIWRYEDWDSLKPAFPKGNEGSKLLFTTRNKEVAMLADPRSSPIELSLLTGDESWKLFKRKAFPENKMESHACSKEFETLGKEMLKKCGGLPLAIVSWNEWEMVQKNINAHLNKVQQQEYGGVNGILALSYNELPFHLKPCFLYLGHYPEDSEISKKELIRLWIAEGFISPSLEGGEMLMEDVAEQYLEELINRCLVQVSRRGHRGTSVKTCRIHDLLRDLCVSEAQEENFFQIIQPPMNGNENRSLDLTVATVPKVRRIAVYPNERYVSLKGKCLSLRSLLLFQDEGLIRLQISKCINFRFLRDPMPALEKLPHLRILSFKFSSYTGTKMSCSVNGFPQLDSLHIYGSNLAEWQIEEGAMPRLRSLHLAAVPGLKMVPEGLRLLIEAAFAFLYQRIKKEIK
ncbi:NB-ARC - like 10, partial [Theobroma cacao]